ncbi:MAG: RidA family protein, partial [Chloroflexi bacterium]|nr:RidA family protein [Chloroflexota bacterium]
MSAHNADAKALEMGLDLSTNPPLANYVPAVRTGNLVFLSGHGPFQDGQLIRGKLGADLDVDAGYQAARAVMVQLLGSLRAEIGSLDRVSRIVKLLCMV